MHQTRFPAPGIIRFVLFVTPPLAIGGIGCNSAHGFGKDMEKADEKITVQKVGFYLFQFVVSPILVGLILGFFSLLITGQFNGAGGVTLIGTLVTVASNSNSGQA